MAQLQNIDTRTVEGFGDEWEAFDQLELDSAEHRRLFDVYFRKFPIDALAQSEGFDLGCGSGRWAFKLAPNVGKLHCIDPSPKALAVSSRRLHGLNNVEFHIAGAHDIPLEDGSQDFGYSLGVLHHIPDTARAMAHCVAKLKPGAPFLVYLYYNFDNRPDWYRWLWKASDLIRIAVSRLPFRARRTACELIAAALYYPMTRVAAAAERSGVKVSNWPLSAYRNCSFYTMRTDALDRFGTRLEQRFSRAEIVAMMTQTGLTDIEFNEEQPYWVAVGRKQTETSSKQS